MSNEWGDRYAWIRERFARRSDAERWLDAHGFAFAGESDDGRREQLDQLLGQEPDVRWEEALWPRWVFPDGSSVVARSGGWDVEEPTP